jgi:protein kinase-like protein
MGVVWQAHDGLLDRDVAVKEIYLVTPVADPDDPADPFARRAVREAQAAAQLKHPGIITVYDVVIDDGRPWIVMELVDGRSLAQVVVADGVLSEQRAALIGLRVLDALGAAHRRGILHRDVKPANILLDGDRVVLTDFGIAAIDGATALTATGQMVGSPAYLAPERINGRPATAAADLWALGVTLYAAVAGRSPFQRDDTQGTYAAVLTSRPARPGAAGRLWPAIHGLLAKDPDRRLTADLAAPLLAAVAYSPATAEPAAAPRRPRWWPARHVDEPPQPAPVPRAGLPHTVTEPPAAIQAESAAGDPSTSAEAPAVPDAVVAGATETATATAVPTRPEAAPSSAGETPAARPTAKAIRWISVAAAAALLVAAYFVWVLPAQLRYANPGTTPTRAEGSPSTVRAATPSAPPSWTPPAPPAGFKAVTVYAVYLAVPKAWTAVGSDGWSNDDTGPDVLERAEVRQDVKGKGTSAVAYVASVEKDYAEKDFLANMNYRRVRLTPIAAPPGAKSAADWEYTTTVTNYWLGHEHELARVIAWPDGTINVVAVSVEANSTAELKRDWTKARPTAVKIVNSVALHR